MRILPRGDPPLGPGIGGPWGPDRNPLDSPDAIRVSGTIRFVCGVVALLVVTGTPGWAARARRPPLKNV